MESYRLGVLSDTHYNAQTLEPLFDRLSKEGIDALVLNGDVGQGVEHIAYTLQLAARTGLPVYVQPGSHEDVASYSSAIDALAQRHPNLIDACRDQKHIKGGYQLVFLPGSDWHAGGQFDLKSDIPTGEYLRTDKGLVPIDSIQRAAFIRNPAAKDALWTVRDMSDLDKLVTDAEHTVVFCHIPARYADISTGVDMAYFAENQQDGSVMPGIVLESMIRQQFGDVSSERMRQVALANGFVFKQENRGNEELGKVYARNGITKAVSGHFHESVHRAHDARGSVVGAGDPAASLFYMASYADIGRAGVVTLKDEKMSYEPVVLG